MSAETYEIMALAARYWFITLAALIVLRGWRASVKDNRNAKILRDWAGGSGCVGELVVLEDGVKQKKKSLKGARLSVPAEGLLGSGRTADIRIRHSDLKRKHVWLTYQPGMMQLSPVRDAQVECPVLPDGQRVLKDGDQLCVGRLKLMMVFYDVQDAVVGQPMPARRAKPERKAEEEEYDDPFEENFWE